MIEERESAARLEALYRSWGILRLLGETVETMPPEWLPILNIARHLLEGKPIPGVSMPAEITALLERQDDVQYERRIVKRTRSWLRVVRPEEAEVRPIESPGELPRIVASQRMWQFIDPTIFFYRVYTHD